MCGKRAQLRGGRQPQKNLTAVDAAIEWAPAGLLYLTDSPEIGHLGLMRVLCLFVQKDTTLSQKDATLCYEHQKFLSYLLLDR